MEFLKFYAFMHARMRTRKTHTCNANVPARERSMSVNTSADCGDAW